MSYPVARTMSRDAAVRVAGSKLNSIVKEIERPGLRVMMHVKVGDVPYEISSLADREDA